LRIQLTPVEVARYSKPVRGRGGFQTLLRRISKQISPSGVMTVSAADAEKIVRYSFQYGPGGFEDRTKDSAKKV
jgi:hypothetical protein